MIEIHNLAKRFTQGSGKKLRTVQAVADVSFKADDGCITGLLGPNGAGKTTTLRMAAALIVADAGRIVVDGINVAQAPQRAAAVKSLEGQPCLSAVRGKCVTSLYDNDMASTVCGRSSGFLARQRRIRASRSGGILGLSPRGRGGGAWMCPITILMMESPVKGSLPVKVSKSTTPRE